MKDFIPCIVKQKYCHSTLLRCKNILRETCCSSDVFSVITVRVTECYTVKYNIFHTIQKGVEEEKKQRKKSKT